jgi:hypothetical protein
MSLDPQLSRDTLSRTASRFFGVSDNGRSDTGSPIFTQSDTISARSRQVFRFDGSSNLNLDLTGKNRGGLSGNLDLQVFDASGLQVAQSAQNGNKSESITLANLSGGTFFIAITNETDQNIPYESEASNNGTSELILPEKSVEFNKVMEGRVSDRDTSDFYALSLGQRTNLKVVLDEPDLGLSRDQNANVRLVIDRNRDRLVQSSGETVDAFDSSFPSSGNKRTFLFTNLDPNQSYYIQVSSNRGPAFYELKVSKTNDSRIGNALVADGAFIASVAFDGPSTNSTETSAETVTSLPLNTDLSSLSLNMSDVMTTQSSVALLNLTERLPVSLISSILPGDVAGETFVAQSWADFDLVS